jgi:hypothetical protein
MLCSDDFLKAADWTNCFGCHDSRLIKEHDSYPHRFNFCNCLFEFFPRSKPRFRAMRRVPTVLTTSIPADQLQSPNTVSSQLASASSRLAKRRTQIIFRGIDLDITSASIRFPVLECLLESATRISRAKSVAS